MKTILITGTSSGFGCETAKYFLSQGWKVVATMRNPQDNTLPNSEQLSVLPLDVTDIDSINNVVEATGTIDVLVNNAGIGMLGDLEGTPIDVIREVFEINTLGTINMTKAFLPKFRQQRTGAIVNVTSSVTLLPHALLSVYSASKSAINAFSEVLALELEAFNIRVNLVIPGQSPETSFSKNAQARMTKTFEGPYSEFAKNTFKRLREHTKVTHARDVAETIWLAANDENSPMRIIAGADAKELIA